MRKIFLIVFLIVFLTAGNNIGYMNVFPVWKHFTYVFQHASMIHLLLNALSFYFLFGALQQFIKTARIITISYGSAVAMSFFTAYTAPVVGASGMIYAMIGIYIHLITQNRIRFKDRNGLIVFIVSVATFLIVSLIKTDQAGMLHLLCMTAGFATSYLTRK